MFLPNEEVSIFCFNFPVTVLNLTSSKFFFLFLCWWKWYFTTLNWKPLYELKTRSIRLQGVFVFLQIARDTTDRVFTWGFGGYGRLGHHQPKDEHIPRLVAFFKGKSECKPLVLWMLFYSLQINLLVLSDYSVLTCFRLFSKCIRCLFEKSQVGTRNTDIGDLVRFNRAVWINSLTKKRKNGKRKKRRGEIQIQLYRPLAFSYLQFSRNIC